MKRVLTLFLIIVFVICLYPAGVLAHFLTVEKVHAGDIIEFGDNWKTRITGVKAPGPDEPFGQEAFLLAQKVLDGKRVAVFTYTLDNTATGIVYDEDGYPFAQIEYGDSVKVDYGALLMKKGLARVDEKFLHPDLEHYKELEKEAREKKIGIWGELK